MRVITGIAKGKRLDTLEGMDVRPTTDRVKEGEEGILIHRYHAQMESYKQALEKITGKNVKEIYIYSVTLQKTIMVHV